MSQITNRRSTDLDMGKVKFWAGVLVGLVVASVVGVVL